MSECGESSPLGKPQQREMTASSAIYQWEKFINVTPLMELINISNKCVPHKGNIAICKPGYKLLQITQETGLGNEQHFATKVWMSASKWFMFTF